MYCNECLETVENYNTIGSNNYCTDCINKYHLVKCPNDLCDNVISINGYDDMVEIENDTCSICDTIYCSECIIRDTNLQICTDCFNS